MCTRNSPVLSLTCERQNREEEGKGDGGEVEACSVRRSGMILKTLSTHCNPSPYWDSKMRYLGES